AEKAYGSRPEVIPNGVAMEPVREISAISDPVRLLWVGRMSVQKNPLLALEALAHIREENWKLEMVGDGPLRRNAENFAEQMGIASKVCFHGWLESSEVWRLQRECPILLLTSLHEGMPMVAVEGLMAGMAILSTCIPGVEDVVEDDWNGRKMPFHPDLIGNEIISLLRDPKRLFFYRTNSQKKAREFSLERVVEKYEFILTKKSKK
ncbi:MAG: glycosyltransferase family 4 protein, partial [Chthoniobacterales bacterium]|nr:glycosyltransferase family 4 protein [Chthoniobacterales bacterium]